MSLNPEMLHVCSWLKHGRLLTSLTAPYFMLNISQLARVMLMLRVKWSEQRIYLAVFLHVLPSGDLSSHWWWLTHIYSSPPCPSATQTAVDVAETRPLVVSLRTHSPLVFLYDFLSSCFLFACCVRRLGSYWSTVWLTKWMFDCLTVTWLQLCSNYNKHTPVYECVSVVQTRSR